jgi:histidine triad (HIT) family protein
MDCLFCKIADGSVAAKIVYEDEYAVAFDDINAQAPQHKIIIPKKHIATLNDTLIGEKNELAENQKLLGHLMMVAAKLAKTFAIAETGYRLVMNCNQNGGQSVYHIHVHLLGERLMSWPPG